MPQQHDNLIGGEWLAGGGYSPNINPSNLADVVGEEELAHGRRRIARWQLARSLACSPLQPRTMALLVAANAVIATTVPTPNAPMYVRAAPRVGSARAGSTPRKCELPAIPCRIPMQNDACAWPRRRAHAGPPCTWM